MATKKDKDKKDISKHKNKNMIFGNFVIYIITIFEEIFKFGKADADRITQSSGLPTRLHQQLRKLGEKYGEKAVDAEFIAEEFGITTKEAKKIEKESLQDFFDVYGFIPKGNQKSFKPKKK